MPQKLYPVPLSAEAYLQLRHYGEGGNKPARASKRARILLLAEEHMSEEEILATLGVDRKTLDRVRKQSFASISAKLTMRA